MSTRLFCVSKPAARQRGLTLIELIFFIVIVGAALAGVLTVLNITTGRSADPLVRKQMLAIAEAVLEEVRLQSFTWCDPNDANAATAIDATGCAGGTPAETRGDINNPFDQVIDYNGAVINNSLAGVNFPAGYVANVVVTPGVLNGIGVVDPNDSLLIRVTVTSGAENLVLEGYRTRYAPAFLP